MGTIADAAGLGGGPPSFADSIGAPDIANADAVGQETTQLLNDTGAQSKQGNAPQPTFYEVKHTFNKGTGTFDVSTKMSQDTFDHLSNLAQTGQAAMDAFAQARQQLMAKRVFQQQNPFVSAIGRIASTAAADYSGGPNDRGRISPIIRAAGAFGLDQFGQTPDALAQQEAGLAAQQFGISSHLYDQQQQDRKISNDEAQTKTADARAQIELARLGVSDQEKVYANFSKIAQQESPISPEVLSNFVKQATAKGMTLQAAQAQADTLKQENDSVLAATKADKVQKVEKINGRDHIVEHWLNPRTQKEVGTPVDLGVKDPSMAETLASQKKQEEDSTIEEIAQRAVSKDPNLFVDPKQIASTRNMSLLKVYKRMGQLDPTATPAILKARTDTFNAFTSATGAGAQSLASLGQFVQHADQAVEAAKALGNTNSEWLNKPINDLRSKVTSGSPQGLALERLAVAIEPAKNEFEKFIISASGQSNRALYESDRKSGDRLLNQNMPLSKIITGVKQMGETAAAVKNEQENKWNRVFPGSQIPTEFSPQAQVAASKLGIKLGTAPTAAGGPSFDDFQKWQASQGK